MAPPRCRFALGFSEDLVPYVTIGVLLLIGVVLTVSPVVYKTVEKIQFFMVALIVLFVVYAAVALLGTMATPPWVAASSRCGRSRAPSSEIPIAVLMGAIAFAGAGGVMNLVQSNWVRDKGLGMGARLPKVVSPFTGEEVAAPDDRLLLPPRRGEHAALEGLVEGRRHRAELHVLR